MNIDAGACLCVSTSFSDSYTVGALSQWRWNEVMLVKFEPMLEEVKLMLVNHQIITKKSQSLFKNPQT